MAAEGTVRQTVDGLHLRSALQAAHADVESLQTERAQLMRRIEQLERAAAAAAAAAGARQPPLRVDVVPPTQAALLDAADRSLASLASLGGRQKRAPAAAHCRGHSAIPEEWARGGGVPAGLQPAGRYAAVPPAPAAQPAVCAVPPCLHASLSPQLLAEGQARPQAPPGSQATQRFYTAASELGNASSGPLRDENSAWSTANTRPQRVPASLQRPAGAQPPAARHGAAPPRRLQHAHAPGRHQSVRLGARLCLGAPACLPWCCRLKRASLSRPRALRCPCRTWLQTRWSLQARTPPACWVRQA